MKTIFITIFQAVEVKNIVRTRIFDTLLEDPDVRVVLLTLHEQRADYYRKYFFGDRISYAVVTHALPFGLDALFSKLKFSLLCTESTDLRREFERQKHGSRMRYYGGRLFNRLLSRRGVLHIVRWLDFFLVRRDRYAELFETYRPHLVVLGHLFDDAEIALLRSAKKRGIQTIGIINSWDKPTTRCAIRLLPTKCVVFNDIVKRELVEHHGVRAEDIFVGGIPHYDVYDEPSPQPKRELFRDLGITDPCVQRLIVYAPNGRYSGREDMAMIDLLHSSVEDGSLPSDVALLVRFQPNDVIDRAEVGKRPWLVYDHPGIRFGEGRGGDWDMTPRDTERLVSTLYHASVVVCYTSSLSVDAARLDTPVINIKFDLVKVEDPADSPVRFYRMTHYKKALESGGIRVVHSRDELLAWLNRYLDDPSLDQDGRHRLVSRQCKYLDGLSGKRTGTFILSHL
jgi:hypothetical protein